MTLCSPWSDRSPIRAPVRHPGEWLQAVDYQIDRVIGMPGVTAAECCSPAQPRLNRSSNHLPSKRHHFDGALQQFLPVDATSLPSTLAALNA